MTMRLGFAVAMLTRPDILILDEVFAVGDASFQKKCITHMREIRKSGTSLLFVSHSILSHPPDVRSGHLAERRADGDLRQPGGGHR